MLENTSKKRRKKKRGEEMLAWIATESKAWITEKLEDGDNMCLCFPERILGSEFAILQYIYM